MGEGWRTGCGDAGAMGKHQSDGGGMAERQRGCAAARPLTTTPRAAPHRIPAAVPPSLPHPPVACPSPPHPRSRSAIPPPSACCLPIATAAPLPFAWCLPIATAAPLSPPRIPPRGPPRSPSRGAGWRVFTAVTIYLASFEIVRA
jgi:hypothetical protein